MCNTVMLPSHGTYMQKQVIGGLGGCDRNTSHPNTRHCAIGMILKLLFQG